MADPSYARCLTLDGVTNGWTSWDREIQVSVTYWSSDESSYGAVVTCKPSAVDAEPISYSDGLVRVAVGDPTDSLAAMIADGSIIGRQAHYIELQDSGSGWTTKRDWLLRVSHAEWHPPLVALELRPWRTSSLLGIGIYGLLMSQRCAWRYGSSQCLASGVGCDKTTIGCKSNPYNLLASDNAASIETDASAWVAFGSGVTISRATTAAYHGSASLQAACDGTVAGLGVMLAPAGYASGSAGGTYCASAYVRAASGSGTLRIRLRWYDSAGNLIGTSTEYADVALSSSWQRVSVSATAPANTAKIGMDIATTAATAVTFQLDAAMIQKRRATWEPLPGPWALPSWGNLRRYGGFVAPPIPGQEISYRVASPATPVLVIERPAAPQPSEQPETPAPRQPQRRLTPAPEAPRQPRQRLTPAPGPRQPRRHLRR